ncbi:MAG TPA: YdeI/OmpD-associated family protein [bacterium]|nr:YdeI/OmpD-associated family protein [bacterium]
MRITKTLYVHKVKDWRSWLKKHHGTAREIWLIYYKKHSAKPRISYNDAVDEAMCFGWIDSTVKTLDKDRYCQRFSPRKKGSPVSELNKHRAMRLIREKRMTPAGLASLEGTLRGGAKLHRGRIKHVEPFRVPAYVRNALVRAGAWKNFEGFPLAYQRIRVGWITMTRLPHTRRTRLAYFVKMTAQNKRFGMVQG